MLGHDKIIPWEFSGNLAVQVFFALSGWLIGTILLNLNSTDLPRFFYNRIVRIWVPYYFAFFLLLLVACLKDQINPKWLEIVGYQATFVYNLFGTQQLLKYKSIMPLEGTGNGLWSVNAEEQFYLIAPLMLVLLPKFGQKIISWVLISITLYFTIDYSSISFGVLAALLNKRYPDFHSTKVATLLLLILLLLCIYGFTHADQDLYNKIKPFFAISCVLLLARKGARNPISAFLGGVSYPLYLNHWIGVFLANFLFGHSHDSLLRNIVSSTSNILICSIFYVLIDKKMLSIRDRLYTVKRGKIALFTGYLVVTIGVIFGLIIKYLFPIELS